ncbi:MAG: hypothetical protein J5879_09130 [Clostridia bacterium]|nr:hypothetical protein [Clostridia bacterium]
MKKNVVYIIISVIVLALQALLIRLGYVGFAFGAALASAFSLTLNLTKKTVIAAVFSAAALSADFLILPKQQTGVYLMIAGFSVLSFVLVYLMNRFEYGLLLSDAMGALSVCVPVCLIVKYFGEYLSPSGADASYLETVTYYPLLIGCAAGGVVAFLAVPAVNVIRRRANGEPEGDGPEDGGEQN